MNKKQKIISPISIDLGAKNTGVFFTHYPERSTLNDVKANAKGVVYQLEKDNYTLLMANRTAARHARRGHDRRQMAKRLFKLIWEKQLGLDWSEEVAQAIGFLMNRRGFSFLTEMYSEKELSKFPQEAFEYLPDELKKENISKNEEGYDFTSALDEWAKKEIEVIQKKFASINRIPKQIQEEKDIIKARQVFMSRTEKLKAYCETRIESKDITEDKKEKVKLSECSKWILEEWREQGVQGLPPIPNENNVDLVTYLNNKSASVAQQISATLPDIIAKTETEISKKDEELKTKTKNTNWQYWDFKSENFDVEKANNSDKDKERFYSSDDKPKPNIKLHLHHLAFAIHKIQTELESGGRYRTKYFEEINNAMMPENRVHGYMQAFCSKFGENNKFTVKQIANLIGHISNLELNPLRKYFNDTHYQNGDTWDEVKLSKLFHNWICNEWRVGEKDKLKKEGKGQDYSELKKLWREHCGIGETEKISKDKAKNVVTFWLNTEPKWTIPPYQDNNNRRPPKCQSLILNVDYLDKHYKGWESWLEQLQKIESVRTYLGDYEQELKNLSNSNNREKKSNNTYFSGEITGKLRVDSGKRTQKHLKARLLQFIFDRAKISDTYKKCNNPTPLNLNEIYSCVKKIHQIISSHQKDEISHKQLKEYKEKLDNAITNSHLPQYLKAKKGDGDFIDGSFLHLINKYYQLRQKARDGRIFIHPEYRNYRKLGRGFEDTGRYDSTNHLLTYCNHKPRQKRYQLLNDIAGLLQITPDTLKKKLEEVAKDYQGKTLDKIITNWLDEGLKDLALSRTCKEVDKEQKNRKGHLKLDIQIVYGRLYHEKLYTYKGEQKSVKEEEIEKSLKQSTVKDADKLYKLCEKAKEKWLKLTEKFYTDDKQEAEKERLQQNPAAAVYQLAQLNNIAFKERSGNASTCAVCSADNAQRMQMVKQDDEEHAKAQRLAAIEFRIFDGVVKRMARVVGREIAKDKWEVIKEQINNGYEINIPIITESNRFEFEPSREEIVKNQRPKLRKGKVVERDVYFLRIENKKDRIKAASFCIKDKTGIYSLGVSPYGGGSLDASGGEIDHIIPRSSRWGTLNDEANLIYASNEDNQQKGNAEYRLSNLNNTYLQKQFGTSDPGQIISFIEETIGTGEGEYFEFGEYRNFANLTPDQQKAMRHALFLPDDAVAGLRQKVINAIDNKTRIVVNGTQRYFAQVIANELHKLAKEARINTKNLKFDYYSIEATTNSRGDGVHDIRKSYEDARGSKIAKYKKEQGKTQETYSHLIDAMVAFAIAADNHRNDGGLKITIDAGMRTGPCVDKEGELIFENSLLDKIMVLPDNFKNPPLKRRQAKMVETHDRQKLKNKIQATNIPYKIHQDSIVAENFFPLRIINCAKKEIGCGFYANALQPYKWEDYLLIKDFYYASKKDSSVLIAHKKDIQVHLMEVGRIDNVGKNELKICKILDKLRYSTIKKNIIEVLTIDNNAPNTVGEALTNWHQCVKEDNFIKKGVLLPIYGEWKRLKKALEQSEKNNNLQKFLESYMLEGKQNTKLELHNKVRKVFSLPVHARNLGTVRIKRKSWCGNSIVQFQHVESLSKYGVDGKDRPHTILSKHSIPVGHYLGIPESLPVEDIPEWVAVPDEEIKEHKEILSAEVNNKEAGRCLVRIKTDQLNTLSIYKQISQDSSWKGKVNLYKEEEEFKNAKKKDSKNFHGLEKNWKFFNPPFQWAKINAIKIEKIDANIHLIEYTIGKTKKVKDWLKSN